MNTILLSMASWLAINIITWLSGKLHLSKTYVSVGLALLLWIWVYAFQLLVQKYPVQREQVMWFMWWAYWTSQAIYNLYKKIVNDTQD